MAEATWTHITPCDDSLAGVEHEPHEYDWADQVYECDGKPARCLGYHGDGLVGDCALCGRPRSKACGRLLRGGHSCALDRDHRGRCSSVAFRCECCGKTRRGRPHAVQEFRLGDGTVDDVFEFCFMCIVVGRGVI